MCYLRPDTFNHEPFRRGKPDMYGMVDMERFDTDFRLQLHFNFSATRNTFKQKQSLDMNRASRIQNIMFLPGDWHTGMNMLQSIYKVF